MAIEETRKCVNSILNNVAGEKKIVIVDNSSPNGSGMSLKAEYASNQDIVVIITESNLGFARGNNIGYNYAIKRFNPRFIVVMNNDMEISQKDFISRVADCYEEYHFHIMGPDIFSTKKLYHQNPQTRALPTLASLRRTYVKMWIKDKLHFLFPVKYWIISFFKLKKKPTYQDRPFEDTIVEGRMLHGSCYVFSDLFMQIHPEECFFSETFMYLEAEILYYQSKLCGETIIYCPDIQVLHHEDMATDAVFKKQYAKSAFSVRCLMQSSLAFYKLMKKMGELKN